MNRLFSFCLILSLSVSFSSCDFLSQVLTQQSLSKEKLMYLRPEGALIYGTVEKNDDDAMYGLQMMLRNSADLYIPLRVSSSDFLIEVPYNCDEISRYGIKYSLNGVSLDYWRNMSTRLVLSSNQRGIYSNETISVMKRMVNGEVKEITNSSVQVSYETQVFYLGHFIIKRKDTSLYADKLEYAVILTNRIDEDQQRFYDKYPMLSNVSFIQAEIYHTNN